nr:unnamed protein product [Digitaria exilis]
MRLIFRRRGARVVGVAGNPSSYHHSSRIATVSRQEPELVGPARPTLRETKRLSDIDDQQGLRLHVPLVLFYRRRVAGGHGDDPAAVVRRALGEALDKWKNLVKACKKVIFSYIFLVLHLSLPVAALQCISLIQDSGRMLLPLEQSLIQRIMEIDHNDPYPKQSNDSALDRLAPFAPNLPLVLQQPPSLTARWSVVKARTKRDSMHTLKNSNKNTPRGPSSFRIGTNETN